MIKPFGDFCLIRLAKGSSYGHASLAFGTVLAVGDDMAATDAGVGDTYYFRNGLPVKDPDTGEEFVLVHYDDIVACVEADKAEEPAKVPSFGGYTDWIPWSGGECPFDDDVEVIVVLRHEVDGSGDFSTPTPAGNWFWSHLGNDDDIVFYRLV